MRSLFPRDFNPFKNVKAHFSLTPLAFRISNYGSVPASAKKRSSHLSLKNSLENWASLTSGTLIRPAQFTVVISNYPCSPPRSAMAFKCAGKRPPFGTTSVGPLINCLTGDATACGRRTKSGLWDAFSEKKNKKRPADAAVAVKIPTCKNLFIAKRLGWISIKTEQPACFVWSVFSLGNDGRGESGRHAERLQPSSVCNPLNRAPGAKVACIWGSGACHVSTSG